MRLVLLGLVVPLRPSWFSLDEWPVFRIHGRDADDLLGRLSSNDLRPLRAPQEPRAVTTLFLSPAGRLLHRVLLQPEVTADSSSLRALAEPGSAESFPAWLERYTFAEDIQVALAPDLAAIRVLGVEPQALAAAAAAIQPTGPPILWSSRDFGAVPSVLITGARADLLALAERACPAGRLEPIEQEQLRIEAGEPAAGAEITADHFPLEAGLLAEISFTKGCYTGQEVVARQDAYGKVARRLVRVAFEARPAVGDVIQNQGREVGAITSVAPRPIDIDGAARFLALAFVPTKLSDPGSVVTLASGLECRVLGP